MRSNSVHSQLLAKDDKPSDESDEPPEPQEASQITLGGWRSWAGLGIYSLCSISNAVVAYGFSAMIEETQAVMPVLTDQQITLLLSYASIVPVCAIVPSMWLLAGPNGLYRTLMVGALTLVFGAGFRLLPFAFTTIGDSDDASLVLIHLGSVVNCVSTTVFLTTPSAFSVAFFPDSQRTTATAIASTCFELGTAFVFLVPKITSDVTLFLFITFVVSCFCLVGMFFQPQNVVVMEAPLMEREMMPSISEAPTDGTVPALLKEPSAGGSFKPPETAVEPPLAVAFLREVSKTRKSTKNRPSTMHLESSSNLSFLAELKLAFSKRSFLAMALATSVVQGVWEAWTPLVTEELTYLSENEADNIAFLASLGTICGGFVIGPIADRCCNQQLKSLILLCISGMCGLFALFTAVMPLPGGPLDSFDWISGLRHSGMVLYVPMFGTGFFQGALVPLAYEVLAEMSYPVSEGTSGGLLQIVNNGTSLILIFTFGAGISDEWFNLVQWVAMFICLFMVGCTKVSYGRGPNRIALSKGSARSSVFSKNPFHLGQHRNTLSSAIAAANAEQGEYVAPAEELL